MPPTTCASGQIAQWDGSAWVCGDDASLTTSDPNLSIAAGDLTMVDSPALRQLYLETPLGWNDSRTNGRPVTHYRWFCMMHEPSWRPRDVADARGGVDGGAGRMNPEEMEPWLALAFAGTLVCAVVRAYPGRRRRVVGPPDAPAAQVARADALLARAGDHHRAHLDGENPFDQRRARRLASEARRLLDDVCDRVPDRERPAELQRLRQRARALQEAIEAASRRQTSAWAST